MSDLKLVYRTLRKISEWSLSFYSDVYVTGQQNVPEDGPVLLIPCHHNEIIDIATLSVTIPFRRPVCFWAKSTMFRNPVTRAILLSSGSIPVRRSADLDTSASTPAGNGDAKASSSADASKDVHQSLFRETFQALDAGEVIGVFPEGTSYTEPEIAQVKDGAAWVALEYTRWQLEHAQKEKGSGAKTSEAKKLVVIPVGIVYSDKARYQSRVRVEFGEPIDVDAYNQSFRSATTTEDSRSVVRSLTGEIERRLRGLTINAPNWDTWFAARIARDISWGGDAQIPIQAYNEISQSYIDRITGPSVTSSALAPLVKYYALIQRTGFTHDTLSSVYPARPGTSPIPTRPTALLLFLRHLLTTTLHPGTLLFLPPLLVHLPGYLTAALGDRFLVAPGEEEARAQIRAVCGGLGYGLVAAGVGQWVAEKLGQWCAGSAYVQEQVSSTPIGVYLAGLIGGRAGRRAGSALVVYCTIWGIFRWYNALVHANYNRFARLRAAWALFLGVLAPASYDVPDTALAPYTRPILPAANPYIKRNRRPAPEPGIALSANGDPKAPTSSLTASLHTAGQSRAASWRLVRPLLRARAEAEKAAGELGLMK